MRPCKRCELSLDVREGVDIQEEEGEGGVWRDAPRDWMKEETRPTMMAATTETPPIVPGHKVDTASE